MFLLLGLKTDPGIKETLNIGRLIVHVDGAADLHLDPFQELPNTYRADRCQRAVTSTRTGQRKRRPVSETPSHQTPSSNPSGVYPAKLWSKRVLVELQGLEPWTSSMPWKRSSQLSYSPLFRIYIVPETTANTT
jgi:hypothetical protein